MVFNQNLFEPSFVFDSPNGTNINSDCGSQYIRPLRTEVVRTKADLGLAFDGDADRLIAVDEKGREVNGDQILLVCGLMLKAQHRLPGDLLISTVMANLGLRKACQRFGLRCHMAKVGDRSVLEDMLRLGGRIGGEQSGHMIVLDHHTTGDGIITALQLIAAMLSQGRPLSELADLMETYPQHLLNIEVTHKPDISGLPRVQEAIRQAEAELGDEGRVLVRYSGTQNICRIMVEAASLRLTERHCQQIAAAVRAELG